MNETLESPRRLPGTVLISLLPGITGGLILGFTTVFFAVSLASLIFAGLPAEYLARGLAMALITGGISITLMALFSSVTGVIASVQDSPAVLLAVGIASLTTTVSQPETLLATITSLVFLTTLLTGIFLFLPGRFRLGNLVRYVPYPVIGGFLAGMGWLLVHGALGTMTNIPLTLAALPQYAESGHLLQWVPGVLFGLILFVGVRAFRHSLTLPGLLLPGFVVFYGVLLLTGTSLDDATRLGLLTGSVGSADWQPLPVTALLASDYPALLNQAGQVLAIILLALVHLLLNISALELLLETDVDLNRELRLIGLINMVNALAGGLVSYHSLTMTSLGQRIGVRDRFAGVIAGACSLLVLTFSAGVLMYVPRPLVGGLLFYLGLTLLNEWVIVARRRFNRQDYLVILVILLVIAFQGFLTGVVVGVALLIASFVVNYSRASIFHHVLTGAETRSKVERTSHFQRALAKMGQQIYIIELQGFMFFGTASALLDQIRQRALQNGANPLTYVIVDFRRVTGLDSSVAFSFIKAKNLAKTHKFTLVLTHLTPDMQDELMRNGLMTDEVVRVYPDLDHGLEWCEEQLLLRSQVTKMHVPATLMMQLGDLGLKRDEVRRLQAYLERVQFAPGEVLIREQTPADELYFVEVGQVSVYIQADSDKPIRLQTLSLGTVVGELGFFLKTPRTASVIADEKTIAHRLTSEAVERMKQADADLAIAFHQLMLQFVAERLVHANREVVALTR